MRKPFVGGLCAGAAALLMLPGASYGQPAQAYTNSPVNLYAGPSQEYPVVSQLPGSVPVQVMGCVSGYSWCDVEVSNVRGWVYGANLSYPYQGSSVPIMTYGPTIGFPIVTFSIGTYWGRYYRDRPWYHDEPRWERRPPPPPPPRGRPPGHGGPPPGHGGPQQGHGGPQHGHGGQQQGHGGGGHPSGPPPSHGGGGGGGGHSGPPQGHGGGGHPSGPPPSHGGGGGGGGHSGPPQGHGGGGGGGHSGQQPPPR
ncbi:SH3 domain-containing protein [Paraburkholderia sartisoli]|nr:SH3 domain-containing protein [Paraburkholderia sartisoli]